MLPFWLMTVAIMITSLPTGATTWVGLSDTPCCGTSTGLPSAGNTGVGVTTVLGATSGGIIPGTTGGG